MPKTIKDVPPVFTLLKQSDKVPLEVCQWGLRHVQELTKWAARVQQNLVPTGIQMPWHAGVAPPPTWLMCDGGTMNVADYPALYAAIGNTYGGNATVFTLPLSATPMIIKT